MLNQSHWPAGLGFPVLRTALAEEASSTLTVPTSVWEELVGVSLRTCWLELGRWRARKFLRGVSVGGRRRRGGAKAGSGPDG